MMVRDYAQEHRRCGLNQGGEAYGDLTRQGMFPLFPLFEGSGTTKGTATMSMGTTFEAFCSLVPTFFEHYTSI